MKAFKDANGETRELELTYALVVRVKEVHKVDFFNVEADGAIGLHQLQYDFPKLVAVVYMLCAEKLKDGVTEEQFGRGMRGEGLENATQALLAEISDFFPPRQRKVMLKGMEKTRAVEDALMKKHMTNLDAEDAEAEAERIWKEAEATLNKSTDAFGSLLESSE